MKIAFVDFGGLNAEIVKNIFACEGVEPDAFYTLSPSDDIGFRRGYGIFRDTADVLIVADGAKFDLKSTVAEFLGTSLTENENARKMLEERGERDFSGALMPFEATLIPNDLGLYQGFIAEDRDFTLIVLSGVAEEFYACCKKFVLPYLSAKNGITKTLVFKCFADKTDVSCRLEETRKKHAFDFVVFEDCGDVTVTVLFKDIAESECRAATRDIAGCLKDVCYADGNAGLSETLFALLKLGGRKISVAESFTGGRVVSAIIKNAGASAYLHEGIVCYSDESKVLRTGVSASDIKKFGAVSAQIAYQMVSGLLKTGKCDIAVATTGLAGPDGDGTGKPVGLCYVAAGTKSGIHTYKFLFDGNRERITSQGVNAALFSAVKTIKNI